MDFGDLFDERTFTFSDFQEFTVSILGVFVLFCLAGDRETHAKLTHARTLMYLLSSFSIKARILDWKNMVILKYSKCLIYFSM